MSAIGWRASDWHGHHWCRPATRLAVYLRDGLACCWCGHAVENGAQLSLDHCTTVARSGKPDNRASNLITSCSRCNSARGKRTMKSFAKAVSEYLNNGVTPEQILSHIARCRRRVLPREQAREMLANRGTVSKVLQSKRVA